MHLDPTQDVYDRWRAFVTRSFRLRRMYTETGSLVEMSALLAGFDNGIGRPLVLKQFQEWMSARHPERPELVFTALVVHEAFNTHDGPAVPTLTAKENETAVDVLAELFIAFLDSRTAG